MAKVRDIEEVFFGVLQEDGHRGEISQEIKDFKDSDWQRLWDFSIKNGLFPIFYSRLLSLNLENIPSGFLLKLKDLYLLNLKRNLILERELFKIISIFREANIPVIPLKGPFWARYLYQDLALRQTSCDLDILVPEGRLEAAEETLENSAYHTDQKMQSGYHKFDTQITFCKTTPGETSCIDLHWALRDRFIHICMQDFWLNARQIYIDDYQILAPSPEDILLYLSLISIFSGSFMPIRDLYDLNRLMVRFSKEIDWQVLIKRARKFNLDTALFFALRLSQEFFHTKLPKGILDILRPNFIKENLGKLWINKVNVLSSKERAVPNYTWHYFISIYLRSQNLFECVRIIYKKIFRPLEEVMWTYQQPLSKVSYYLYIKRLLKPFIPLRPWKKISWENHCL